MVSLWLSTLSHAGWTIIQHYCILHPGSDFYKIHSSFSVVFVSISVVNNTQGDDYND